MKKTKRTSARQNKGKGRATKAPKRAARAAPKRAASARRKAKPKPKPQKRSRATSRVSKWIAFVAKHGVVLASAKGPVPCVAEAVAGEPIVGSWWAHPKGKAIFAALSEIDDSADVRCFKLVDGKVTFVHRKAWPALVRLGTDGVIAAEQLASVQQEHMPTGEHRNFTTPFPDWVDEVTLAKANALTADKARAQLAWVDG